MRVMLWLGVGGRLLPNFLASTVLLDFSWADGVWASYFIAPYYLQPYTPSPIRTKYVLHECS